MAKERTFISEADYLAGELSSEIKHHLIDGQVYAMTGASVNHDRIANNVRRMFGNHLLDGPCETLGSDIKVKVGSNYFYPDAMVDCDFDSAQSYFIESPILIVEVLSQSTRRIDLTKNAWLISIYQVCRNMC